MTSRLEKLRQLLVKEHLSHLLITDTIDVAYITGFQSTNAALLISRRSNRLFTDFRYQEAVTEYCNAHPEWTFVKITTCLADAIAACLPKGSCAGFQSEYCTVDEYKKIKRKTPDVRFIGCGAKISDLLMAKQPEEIALMQKAAAIGDTAISELIRNDIEPGVSEVFLARKLERYCADLGSDKPSFDTIILFGARSALPHGRPGTAILKKNEFVLIDFGCTVQGFASDMTRTVIAGRATKKQREIYTIVRDAQDKACNQACVMMTGAEIDALARSVIDSAGYDKEFGHALGHGLGRRIHEPPRVGAHTKAHFPEHTVITIEPGIYIPGFGGVRIEDMAVLHTTGVQLLTHTSKELVEL